ncbi:MAG: hypothetical protein ABR537_12940 [Gemmatimonadales bacterium]
MNAETLLQPVEWRPRVGVWLGGLLFFLMLVVPAAYQPVKAALLALVLAAITVQALSRGGLPLHRTIVLWTLASIATGLFFMVRGVGRGAPGATEVGRVYALWPLVYTILIAGVANPGVVPTILRVLVVATIAIGLYGASYILHFVGLLPDALYIPLAQNQRIGFYGGFVEFNIDSLASLLFLIPFTISALMTWPSDESPISRRWLWIALIVGTSLAALSARRALLLVIALSPLFALMLRRLLPRAERRASRPLVLHFLVVGGLALTGLAIALHFLFGLRFGPMLDMFKRGFAFDSYVRGVERRDQILNLVSGWKQVPLLGTGHGGVGPGWPRSQETPWAYELSYLALLFHTGLLGFLIYASGVGWIFTMSIRIIRHGNRLGLCTLSVLVGTLCFLIANGADPYLEKYDYMWVIFLPVALINVWLCTRESLPLSHDRGP